MAQTLPIPAGQPLEATRTAAGQVVTLAGAEAVAVQAAASLTLAALLWPLIPGDDRDTCETGRGLMLMCPAGA